MANLHDILYKVRLRSVSGSTSIDVSDVAIDSRKVTKGCCFIAIKGNASDGHDYIYAAVEAGAVAIICEQMPLTIQEGITYIQVENTASAAGYVAHNFFGEPSKKFTLVGVTGTNGKTTIATLLFKLFTALGYKCGLVSTVKNMIGDKVIPATHTTPDAVSLNKLLKQMWMKDVPMCSWNAAVMPFTSTGLRACILPARIFSNITHDHLDYHKTFDEYIRVKKSFFDNLPSRSICHQQCDDKRGMVMLQNTHAKKYLLQPENNG